MPALSTKTEVDEDVLLRVAESRLGEFDVLRSATPPRYSAAVYLAGYAVEALLKCAICRTLKMSQLPVAFHVHDLGVLLFFSGFYAEIQADAAVWKSFTSIQTIWSEKRRYADPPLATAKECSDMDLWLNDPVAGVVPWLRARL